MDPSHLKAVIDSLFLFAEQKFAQHFVIVAALKVANGVVDSLIDQFLASPHGQAVVNAKGPTP